ncbi:MAG: TonB-dependent receptor plug domain-containing protein [Gemmatimonadota bacterium]|jgi:outer membrane receptor for ferrienterochelin and colicin
MKALRSVWWVGFAVASLASGCATTQAGRPANANVITQEEIQKTPGASTAYDVVRLLRPQFLYRRGVQSVRQPVDPSAGILVYVDGSRVGGVDELKSIPSDDVEEIRWVNARDATTMYGTDHGYGVIAVTTKH